MTPAALDDVMVVSSPTDSTPSAHATRRNRRDRNFEAGLTRYFPGVASAVATITWMTDQ